MGWGRDCRHPFKVPCPLGSLPSQILSVGACPWMALPPGHPRTPRQEEGADQRAGARQGNLRCLLCLRSGEAQPETGWMGALGQRLGWGVEVSAQKPNPSVFTVDKRDGLERGSGSSHQLLQLEASGQVLGHLGQVLFRGRKDLKRVALCTSTGWGSRSTHQTLLLADPKFPTLRRGGPRSRAEGECGIGSRPPRFSSPRHPHPDMSPGKGDWPLGCNTIPRL